MQGLTALKLLIHEEKFSSKLEFKTTIKDNFHEESSVTLKKLNNQ
jgi:hypothetical protein